MTLIPPHRPVRWWACFPSAHPFDPISFGRFIDRLAVKIGVAFSIFRIKNFCPALIALGFTFLPAALIPLYSETSMPPHDWVNIRVVLAGNYADPSILRDGADYYMTHSDNDYTPALLVWHSRDLVHWKPIGYAVTSADGNIWAPDICKYQGLFYIYYPSDGGVHVVTARNPAGPWSKPVDLHLPHRWIDPGHVVGEDGKRYLGLSNGYLVQLSDDGLSTVGEPRRIYQGWPVPWDPDRFHGEGQCLEGPKFFKHGGYFYFVSAENGTAGPPTSHMLVVARAKKLAGPWENCPYNPIVHTKSRSEPWWSRGHGTLFDTPEGRWYVIYHAYKHGFHTLGRFSLIEPVVWTQDGWPTVSPTKISGDPVLDAPVEPPASFHDDFKGPSLDYAWQFDGPPSSASFQNGLVLPGKGTSVAEGAFLTYIPGDIAYRVDTEVSRTGQASAGLVFFYGRKYFAGLVLEPDGLHYVRDNESKMLVPNTKSGHMGLRLVNDQNAIDMYYRIDQGEWKKVDFSYDLSGYNHNTFGHFDSLRPALTVSGPGEATFSSFNYTPEKPSP